jgi:tetratricopeptide (TPR) repeat protein
MTQLLLRSLRLIEQRRFRDAQPFLHDLIQEDPEDPEAYYLLSCCLTPDPKQRDEALDAIDQAIRFSPNQARYHAWRSNILALLNRPHGALKAAEEAKVLDPALVDGHVVESTALLLLGRTREAEVAARTALSIDPQDEAAANQLSHALRLQGRKVENSEQIEMLLANNPESARTHATAGWAALQIGRRVDAEKHFLEALRLEPDNSQSREGLLESFRARSPLYRAYLQYCFLLERMQPAARWALILGFVFLIQIANFILVGPLAPAAVVLGTLYLLFVLSFWVARGLGNAVVLFDPRGRLALKRTEKIEAVVITASVVFGLAGLSLGIFYRESVLLVAGLTLTASSIPASLTFTNPSIKGRLFFGSLAVAIYFFGILAVLESLGYLPANADQPHRVQSILVLALLATWLGNLPGLRQRSSRKR